ncbi:Ig-like domain-containing protein, partial [Neobacillus drentensis]|uniref:Ig-like domain-containing protein n=1 Tax=Neobacillus drentensis TaxID=220684 RepID=UPI00300219E6
IYPGEGYESVSREIKVLSGQRINLNIGLTPYQQDSSITNGVITGIIKDENGVPVEGAKVYANNGAEPVYTDFSGYYALPLEEGSYTVMFEAPTYLSIKKENVQVTKGNKTTLDLLLASSSDNAAPDWASDANLSLSNLGETKVTLTWPAASDNVKVKNYKVFVNGKLQKIVSGTETSTEMTGLTTGTQYTFRVEAGDGSGNWTANGPETSIRTHAQADLAIDFANEKVYVNENSSLTLKTSHATNLYGFDVEIKYDPNLIKVTNIKLNPNFGVNGTSATLLQSNQDGVIRLVGTKLGDTPGITGEADLVDIDFKSLDKEGTAGFTILKGSSVSDTDDSLYVSNQNVQADLAIAIPVEGINLDQTTMTLDTSNNKEGVLVATVYPDNATNKEITWSSSDPGVVEVDQTGKLTAISAGTATITATTNDKQFKAESTITVLSSVTGIELDKKELILDGATKESAVLTAKVLPENATNKKVIWTSSNPSVATVDQTGKVQAVSLGNAVITATTDENGYTATTDVKVTGIANFKVETSKDIIEKGETVSVSLKATDANRLNQFLLDFNYSQDLFDVVNITLDPEFGIDGDSAELSSTNNQGQISIKGKLKDSQEHRDGTLGLVKLTLKAKTKTQSSNLIVKSNSEYVDNNNITYLLKSNVQKGIAITNADVTGDNTIAVNDLSKVAKAFGKRAGEAGYNENLDMNKDGIIDIIDIAYVANKVLNKPISTFALRSFAISAIQPTAVVNSNVNSTSVKLAVDQDLEQLTEGEVVNIKVNAANPNGLFGAQFTFKYDPAKIQLVDNQVHFNNNFSSFGGCTVDTVNGIVKCPVINSGSTTFTEDSVAIGYIPVKIIKAGKTQVSLSDIKTVNNQVKETNENKVDTLDLTVYNTSLNVDEISDKTTVITGTADAGETIIVTIGTQTYKGTTDSTGAFRITIPQQKAGTKVTVTAKDEEGNESKAIEITVKDVTPPSVPSVNEVTDKSTSVTGTAEAGSTITVKAGLNQIGTAVAKDDGTFSVPIDLQEAGTKLTVTATDNAGNESEGIEVTVVEKDVTVPEKPDVNEVTDKDTTVTGQAEAGSKIEVKANGLVIGTGTAGQDGKYKVTIPVQKAGTVLEVTATDTAGNQSEGATIKVIDKTAPTVLTVNTVTEKSKEVTGKTEAGATVSILIGTKIYTAKADA